MRVQVEPTRVELTEDHRFSVEVTVTNSTEVIGGYELRVLGADPSWVTLETDALSLFPGASQSVPITVTLPAGVNAGDRRIAVQVRETTPPQAISVTEIELIVPAREAVRMSLSPVTVTCGRRGRFSLVTENIGNTTVSVSPIGLDPEYHVRFAFTPEVLELTPGARIISDLRASGKRRWFGSPVVRPFGIGGVPPDELPDLLAQQRDAADAKKHAKREQRQAAKEERREARRRAKQERREAKEQQREARRRARADGDGYGDESIIDALHAQSAAAAGADAGADGHPGETSWIDPDTGLTVHADGTVVAPAGVPLDAPGGEAGPALATPPPEQPEPLTQGVMVQRPRLGRGVLSLMALLLAVSVFAAVITIAFSRLVGVSAADRDLAIQVASARDAGAGSGSSVLGGTVGLFTDGSPAPGVTVEVFADGDLTQAMLSTATDDDGVWRATALPEGAYKLRFRGAGFAEVWYPNALTGAEAEAVEVGEGDEVTDLEVLLGGLPASVSGTVRGEDVAGAVLAVEVPLEFLHPVDDASPGATAAGSDAGDSGGDAGASGSPGAPAGGVLRTIPISSDGAFELEDLPSPAVYDLVVTKLGYAPDRQRVDLSGGESRSGVSLTLRTGDGSIAGSVTGPEGALGGAVVTATSGGMTAQTLTLTEGDVGGFTLRGLVTPATYTVTVTADGYTPVTSTLSLSAEQQLDGVLLSLARSSGALSGMVTELASGAPAAGVTVTIASGSDEPLTTVTQSGATAGSWEVQDLPVPGTYTVTFSRDDLQPQTVAVALDAAGRMSAGDEDGIRVAMRSAFATVGGTVRQRTSGATLPVGEATVTLSSGERTYTVTSSSLPAGQLGTYLITGVAPGTYTLAASTRGTTPTTVIISVTAGQNLTYNPNLIEPASVSGVVTSGGTPLPGAEVTMYIAAEYPAKPYAQTVTDGDGRYSFPVVDAPQAYVIEVRRPDSGPLASETIVLGTSEAGVVDLSVTPTAGGAGSP